MSSYASHFCHNTEVSEIEGKLKIRIVIVEKKTIENAVYFVLPPGKSLGTTRVSLVLDMCRSACCAYKARIRNSQKEKKRENNNTIYMDLQRTHRKKVALNFSRSAFHDVHLIRSL